jgi:hypothetical protein
METAEKRQQFTRIGRLDDVGIGPEVVGAIDVPLLGRRTEHNGDEAFQFRSSPDVVEDIETGLARHFDIEQQKMGKGIGFPVFEGSFAEQIVQGLLAIIEKARLNWQARLLQRSPNQKYVMRIIFGNEHTNCSLANVKLVNK